MALVAMFASVGALAQNPHIEVRRITAGTPSVLDLSQTIEHNEGDTITLDIRGTSLAMPTSAGGRFTFDGDACSDINCNIPIEAGTTAPGNGNLLYFLGGGSPVTIEVTYDDGDDSTTAEDTYEVVLSPHTSSGTPYRNSENVTIKFRSVDPDYTPLEAGVMVEFSIDGERVSYDPADPPTIPIFVPAQGTAIHDPAHTLTMWMRLNTEPNGDVAFDFTGGGKTRTIQVGDVNIQLNFDNRRRIFNIDGEGPPNAWNEWHRTLVSAQVPTEAMNEVIDHEYGIVAAIDSARTTDDMAYGGSDGIVAPVINVRLQQNVVVQDGFSYERSTSNPIMEGATGTASWLVLTVKLTGNQRGTVITIDSEDNLEYFGPSGAGDQDLTFMASDAIGHEIEISLRVIDDLTDMGAPTDAVVKIGVMGEPDTEQTFTQTFTENDEAGIIVNNGNLNFGTPDLDNTIYRIPVVLASRPTVNVVVEVGHPGVVEVAGTGMVTPTFNPDPPRLTFTPQNWNTQRDIILQLQLDDPTLAFDEPFNMSFAIVGDSSDQVYADNVGPTELMARLTHAPDFRFNAVVDNDGGDIPEDTWEQVRFTVLGDSRGVSGVVVTVASERLDFETNQENNRVLVSEAQLNTELMLSVRFSNDRAGNDNEIVRYRIGEEGTDREIEFSHFIRENDTAGLEFNPEDVTTSGDPVEYDLGTLATGGAQRIRVRLTSEPSADVRVTIGGAATAGGSDEISVDYGNPTFHTFSTSKDTEGGWNMYQEFIVTPSSNLETAFVAFHEIFVGVDPEYSPADYDPFMDYQLDAELTHTVEEPMTFGAVFEAGADPLTEGDEVRVTVSISGPNRVEDAVITLGLSLDRDQFTFTPADGTLTIPVGRHDEHFVITIVLDDDDIDQADGREVIITVGETDDRIETQTFTWESDDDSSFVVNDVTIDSEDEEEDLAPATFPIGADTFTLTVRLASEPTSNVNVQVKFADMVTIGEGDGAPVVDISTDQEVSGNAIQFTADNWDDNQEIKFSASAVDSSLVINEPFTIELEVLGSTVDEEYRLDVLDLTLTVNLVQTPRDDFAYLKEPSSATIEGATHWIRVWLTGQPRTGVTTITIGHANATFINFTQSEIEFGIGVVGDEIADRRSFPFTFIANNIDDGEFGAGEFNYRVTLGVKDSTDPNDREEFDIVLYDDDNSTIVFARGATREITQKILFGSDLGAGEGYETDVYLGSQPTLDVDVTIGSAPTFMVGDDVVNVHVTPREFTFTQTAYNIDARQSITISVTTPDEGLYVSVFFTITVGVDTSSETVGGEEVFETSDENYRMASVLKISMTLVQDPPPRGIDITRVPDDRFVSEGVEVEIIVEPSGPNRLQGYREFNFGVKDADSTVGLVFDPDPGAVLQIPSDQTRTISVTYDDVVDNALHDFVITINEVVGDGEEPISAEFSLGWTNNDTAELGFDFVGKSLGDVFHGTEKSFMVTLKTEPVGNVIVSIRADVANIGDGDFDVTFTPSSQKLLFTAENWNVPQMVSFTPMTDSNENEMDDYQIVVEVNPDGSLGGQTHEDTKYNDVEETLTAVLRNTGTPGIAVTRTPAGNVVEEGVEVEYVVALTGPPRTGELIRYSVSGSGSTTPGFVNNPAPGTVFSIDSTGDNATYTVSVTFDDDIDKDDDHTIIDITFGDVNGTYMSVFNNQTWTDDDTAGVVISDEDGNLLPANVQVDEDLVIRVSLATEPEGNVRINAPDAMIAAGDAVVVTFSPESLLFTAENWDGESTVRSFTMSPDLRAGNELLGVEEAFIFSLDFDNSGTTDTTYADLSVEDVSVQLQKNGLMVEYVEGDASVAEKVTVAFRVTPTGPDREAMIAYTASESPTEGLVFDPALSESPITIPEGMTRTISVLYDDDIDDDSGLSRMITFTEMGEPSLSTVFTQHWLNDDHAGVIVNGGDQLGSVQVGDDLVIEVALETQPEGIVRVTIGGLPTAGEGGEVNTGLPEQRWLEFTEDNWDDDPPQTFTLSPRTSNNLLGVDEEYTVVFGIATETTDANYASPSLDIPDLPVQLVKNGLMVEYVVGGASVVEKVTVAFEVTPTGPDREAVIEYSASDSPTEGLVFDPDMSSITIPEGMTRTISVSFDDDIDDDDGLTRVITFSEMGDDLLNTEYTQVWTDDDTAAVVANEGNMLGSVQVGESLVIAVTLDSEPTGNVRVTMGGNPTAGEGDAVEITFTPSFRDFTADNWNMPQEFTFSPTTTDNLLGVEETYQVQLGINTDETLDDNYDLIGQRNLPVELEKRGLSFTRVPDSATAGEGETIQFEIEPTGPDRTGGAVIEYGTVDSQPPGMTFTPNADQILIPNGMTRTISVTYDDFVDDDSGIAARISIGEMGDDLLSTVYNQDWNDNDDVGLGFSLADGSLGVVPLRSERKFMVSLTSQPEGVVEVWLHAPDPIAVGTHMVTVYVRDDVHDQDLTFTTSNWNVGQEVTVSASTDDTTIPVDETFMVTVSVHSEGNTADTRYSALSVSVLSGTLNQAGVDGIAVNITPSASVEEGTTIELQVTPTGPVREDVRITINVGGRSRFSLNPSNGELNIDSGETGVISISYDDDYDNDGLALEITVGVDVADGDPEIEETLMLAWTNEPTETAGLSVLDADDNTLDDHDSLGIVTVGTDTTFQVVLNSRPTMNVVVTISSSATDTSGAFGVAFTPESHTFGNNENWDVPVEFTLEPSDLMPGVGVIENHRIEVDVVDDGTEDEDYETLAGLPHVLFAQLQKNGFSVTRLTEPGSVDEGTPITYAVSLTGPDRAAGEELVIFGAEDPLDALEFNPDSFINVPNGMARTVSVTYDDDIVNDDTVYDIEFGGSDYATLFPGQTWINEDEAGLVFHSDDVSGMDLGGLRVDSDKMIRVRLDSQPQSSQVVAVTIGGASPVGVFNVGFPVRSLTFTESDWDTYKVFTVSPTSTDNSAAMVAAYMVVVGVDAAQTGDTDYDNLATTPTVLMADLRQFGPQGLSLSLSTTDDLAEGDWLVVGVSLTGPDRVDSATPARITVGSATDGLVFNPEDGEIDMLPNGEARTISIQVTDDMVAQGDRTFLISVEEVGLATETFMQTWTDDDTAGINSLVWTDGILQTIQVNDERSIPIVLTSEPMGDVVVTIGGATEIAVGDQAVTVEFTPESQMLTFTPADWDEVGTRFFRVGPMTGDPLLGVVEEYRFTIGTDDGLTDDDVYDTVVTVIRTTVAREGLGIGRTEGAVDEGDWVEVTVSLTGPARGSSKMITVGSGSGVVFNPSSGQVNVADGVTAESVISIRVEDDDIDQGMDRSFMVTVGESGTTPARMSVFAQVWTNEDSAGLLVNNGAHALPQTQLGSTLTFPVRLNSQPTHDVVVTIGGVNPFMVPGGMLDVVLTPKSWTFTTENWQTPQAFTLIATTTDDELGVGENYGITVSVHSSNDARYGDDTVVEEIELEVRLTRDEPQGFGFSVSGIEVDEGVNPEGENYWAPVTISLTGPDREGTTRITVSANDGLGIEFNPPSGLVTFPSAHMGHTRTISIAYDDDIDQTSITNIEVTLIDLDPVEVARATLTLTQTFVDEDQSAMVVNDIDGNDMSNTDLGTMQLGVGRSFAVNLQTQPFCGEGVTTCDVRITVGHTETETRGDDPVHPVTVMVNPVELIFNPENWSVEQTVDVLLSSATSMTFTISAYTITVDADGSASNTDDVKYRFLPAVELTAELRIAPSDFVLDGLPSTTLDEDEWYAVAVSLTGQSRGQETTIEFSGDEGFTFSPTDGQVEFPVGSMRTFTVSVRYGDSIDTSQDASFRAALTVRELGTERRQTIDFVIENDVDEMAGLDVGTNLTVIRVGQLRTIPVGIETQPTVNVVVTVGYMAEAVTIINEVPQTIAVTIMPAERTFTSDDWQSDQTFAITISTASTLSLTISNYEIEFGVMSGGAEYMGLAFTLTTQLRSAGLFTEEDVEPTQAAIAVVDLGAAQFALDAIGGNFIGGEISGGGIGQPQLGPSIDLGGSRTTDDDDLDDPWAQNDGWRDDFVTLLDGGKFRLPLGGDGGAGSLEVWGEGRLIDVSGNRDPDTGSYTYDGRATGFVLGIGRRGNNVGYGLAVARTSSKVDIDGDTLSVERIENNVLTMLPYAGVSFGSGSRAWVVGGLGEGKAELLLSGQVENTDSSVRSLGLGFEHSRNMGGYDLAGRLLASGSRSTLDGTEEVPELANVKGSAHRLRAELEAERGVDMFGMGDGTVFGVAALRRDGGDAGSSFGLEVGGGVRGRMMDGYSLEMEGRLQANSSEHEEHSVRLRVGYDSGYDGRGLSLGADGEGAAGADYGWGRTVLGHHGVLSLGVGRDGHGEAPAPRLGFVSQGLRMSVAGNTDELEASFDLVVIGR